MGIPPRNCLKSKAARSTQMNNKEFTQQLAQTRRSRSVVVRRRRSIRSCRRTTAVVVSMKRRGSSSSRTNSILRRVRALKKLIPRRREPESSSSEDEEKEQELGSGGLEGLFSDTASYIMSLQMRVRIMQIILDQFTATTTTDGCCSPLESE